MLSPKPNIVKGLSFKFFKIFVRQLVFMHTFKSSHVQGLLSLNLGSLFIKYYLNERDNPFGIFLGNMI